VNPSTVGDTSLSQHKTHTLGPGGKINLLAAKYEHFVYFTKQGENTSSKDLSDDKNLNQKRRHEPDSAGQSGVRPLKRQKTAENKSRIKTSKRDVQLNENKDDINDLKAEFGEKIIEAINNSQDEVDSEIAKSSPTGEVEPLKSSQWNEAASGTLLIHSSAGLVAREKVQSM
jgi:hypothetical protein